VLLLHAQRMCACVHAGKVCGISYSLSYAAPEVLCALEAGKKRMEIDAAVDVWALGVIACAPTMPCHAPLSSTPSRRVAATSTAGIPACCVPSVSPVNLLVPQRRRSVARQHI
jgi:hypothetical protein